MSQDSIQEKKPGIVKRTASKVAGHTKVRHQIPRWVIYIIGVLGVIALVYGVIQQFRILRWGKLLKAAKIRMVELEADKEQAVWKTTKRLSTKAVKMSQAKIKNIDDRIKKIDRQKEELRQSVGRMKPSDLKAGFAEEGF